ncbi:MAG: diguanylate cyclase, partial [Planctomycetes bacterium]|nr:diguanylate cyclase [Planctomycetota bacterium]
MSSFASLRMNTMRYLRYIASHRRIYLGYTALALLIVVSFFMAQVIFVLKHFELRFAIVPILLGLTIGLLLSSVMSLRKDLAMRNHLFRAVADFAQEFTYFRHVDGTYEYVSPACEKITGYTTEDFYTQPNFMDRLIHPEDFSKWVAHVHDMNTVGHPEEILVRIRTASGEECWISHLCSDVRDDDGTLLGVRSTNLDVTRRINYEQELQWMADYDPLTELPNRRLLMKKLDELVADASERTPFAVMFLDLDRFKNLNDTHGHTFGDELLCVLAARMRECCSDKAFLCRFGGDEFVVVIEEIDTPEMSAIYAKSLLAKIEQPFQIRGQRFFISGSMGIALYPQDSEKPEVLIRNADVAMYRAKLDGRASIGFYKRELVEHAADYLKLENRLRDSLEAGSLQVYFQPRIRLSDGVVVGAEALARWYDMDEWISPVRFISVAEETGLIDRLTEQLLEQTARQSLRWPNLRISFNLSGQQFRRADLCEWIHGIVTAAGSVPGQIELEVT